MRQSSVHIYAPKRHEGSKALKALKFAIVCHFQEVCMIAVPMMAMGENDCTSQKVACNHNFASVWGVYLL